MKHFVTKLAVVVIVLSVNAVDAHADAKLRAMLNALTSLWELLQMSLNSKLLLPL